MKRKTWVLTGTATLGTLLVLGAVVASSGGKSSPGTASSASVNTASVQRGELSTTIAEDGTLTYKARPDGSPYTVVNRATGTFTELSEAGDQIACGGALYRVDDHPVLLLCGTVPAYRDLHPGDMGQDVRQLNENLHALGDDAGAGIDPKSNRFTSQTSQALGKLQHDQGLAAPGHLLSPMRSGSPGPAASSVARRNRVRPPSTPPPTSCTCR